ncbi:MgtC/SapB family protein [Pseudonocardia sp. Cha107L01]|uniref:MgtC/SapB family protein n=1 Tax=Pseudonocardia sp. Cha107L01 TaxID=3457576 RepID=UPI00403EE6F7
MGSADGKFVLRLLLATGCGLLIGLERRYRSRTAGLRTNALVAAEAAVFVEFGEQTGVPAAPLQITAYVVSGVGFLDHQQVELPTRCQPDRPVNEHIHARLNQGRVERIHDARRDTQKGGGPALSATPRGHREGTDDHDGQHPDGNRRSGVRPFLGSRDSGGAGDQETAPTATPPPLSTTQVPALPR